MLPLWEDLFIERTASPGSSKLVRQKPVDLKEAKVAYFFFQVSIEFIFFKLKVMVISCGVVGYAKNRSSAPKEGFFRLPSLVNSVKPLSSEHLRVLKICPLLRGVRYWEVV